MKKIICKFMVIIMVIALFPAFAIKTSAQEEWSPFELEAPEAVSITYMNGYDSINTCKVAYAKNNSMSKWLQRKGNDFDAVTEEMESHGYSDIWVNTQIDWSIDNMTDWKCNDELWLNDGYDEYGNFCLGPWAYFSEYASSDTVDTVWIFRYMGNPKDSEDTYWNSNGTEV